jgi:hypothetical protein
MRIRPNDADPSHCFVVASYGQIGENAKTGDYKISSISQKLQYFLGDKPETLIA